MRTLTKEQLTALDTQINDLLDQLQDCTYMIAIARSKGDRKLQDRLEKLWDKINDKITELIEKG